MPSGLGQRLAYWRKRAGLGSQKEACGALGATVNTIWNYENEKTLPDVDFLARFSIQTGADLQELINLRLQAGGFDPLRPSVQDVRGDYRISDPVDCAAHARQALLSSPDFPRPWCLAVMEMAARGEISPAGVDRLIGFISDHLDDDTA